jgi:hypothetical protein
MTRIAQVKEFNQIVRENQLNPIYLMTTGSGSMLEPKRQRGWVIYQSPKLGDKQDFAKWLPNRKEAEHELASRV